MYNFLQSKEWAEVNKRLGHEVEWVGETLCIIKDAKRGRYLEVPGGPVVDFSDKSSVRTLFDGIVKLAKEKKCVFVRFRPQLLDTPENRKLLPREAILAPFHLHAQNTVILDLTKSEDVLMAEMRRQTRYEVRRVEKMGLVVSESHTMRDFKKFHEVQAETAKRKGFIPPTMEDLAAYHEVFGDRALLYSAKSEGKIVALGLILYSGEEADYFEAASTELNYKLPGSYAVLWQAIRDAKKAGMKRFNLWGIAPPDPENPGEHLKTHRYSGVTTFKTGFSSDEVNFVPAHDIVVDKTRYKMVKLIETARKKWRHLK